MNGNHHNPSAPPSSNGNYHHPSPPPSSNGNYHHPPPPSSSILPAADNRHTPETVSFFTTVNRQQPLNDDINANNIGNNNFHVVAPNYTPMLESEFSNNFHVVAPNYTPMLESEFSNNVGDKNFHVVAPNYTHMLESEFSGLNLAPPIRPIGFLPQSAAYEAGSSSSGNMNHSNGVSLFQQRQLRDIQRMRIQAAARASSQITPNFGWNFDDGSSLNEIWSHNNSAINLNPQPRSFPSKSYESYLNNNNGDFQFNGNSNGSFHYSYLNDNNVNFPYNGNSNGGFRHNYLNDNDVNFPYNGNSNGSFHYGYLNDNDVNFPYNGNSNGSFRYRSLGMDRDRRSSAVMAADWPPYRARQRWNLSCLEEIRGRIYSVSRDQQGCRFLQQKLEEGKAEEVRMIIMEIKEHICEMMVDQFGNYLVHKVFAACNQQQITELLLSVMKDEEIFKSICVDPHGTRSVQKLLEFVRSQEQRSITISALRRITLPLAKNMNGHHVIQFCLKNFSVQDNKYILNEVAENCIEIALDKSGCCVLQQCVEYAVGEPRDRLIAEITSNALLLAEHPYGNYVVQYILGLRTPRSMADIMAQLSGSFVSLSMSKYGSNVVEKFLKDEPVDSHVVHIIRELTSSPSFLRVLQDPFGNYVAQSAFAASKGEERILMMNLVLANHHNLHSHPHGKRVYSLIRNARV